MVEICKKAPLQELLMTAKVTELQKISLTDMKDLKTVC